jgi:agmatine deiminase
MSSPSLMMPAEWAPHEATWFSWPHNTDTWPHGLEPVERAMAEAVRALAVGEAVYVNVLDADHEAHVRRLIGDDHLARVRFFHIPTNDAWVRDHGPIFVFNAEGRRAAHDFRFNSWGGKYPPWDRDDVAARQMADALGVPIISHDLVLEGGAIEVNGSGTMLTTEACLLNPNRNPHLDRAAVERVLADAFGVSNVLWLGDGIVGDDTDGHIDDLTRFVDRNTVLTVVEDDPQDANYHALSENLERLRMMRDERGEPLNVVTLPMPRPVILHGARLPASYANFYIGNAVVLVPTFDDPADAVAVETIQRHFPDRRAVPIHCTDVVWGLGTFHCMTQQVPAGT